MKMKMYLVHQASLCSKRVLTRHKLHVASRKEPTNCSIQHKANNNFIKEAPSHSSRHDTGKPRLHHRHLSLHHGGESGSWPWASTTKILNINDVLKCETPNANNFALQG